MLLVVVGQPHIGTFTFGLPPSFQSLVVVVGQPDEPQSLPDVRSAEARSAGIERPEGVSRTFRVSLYKIEPSEAVLARNLLAKNDWRAALVGKVEERGPQVPLVISPASFACRAERLAGAGARPHRPLVRPPCEPERVTPHADSGEEVVLNKSSKVTWVNILDAPLVDFAGCDMARGNEIAAATRPRRDRARCSRRSPSASITEFRGAELQLAARPRADCRETAMGQDVLAPFRAELAVMLDQHRVFFLAPSVFVRPRGRLRRRFGG